MRFGTWGMVAVAGVLFSAAARAEETKRIQDNSFLIEEAYNQEPGVIQHIQTYQYLGKSKTWAYSFTEEWPAPGQAHQVSITVPINHLDEPVRASRIGDVALNYRYQLLFKGPVAMAPRLSLLLPTGDYKDGFGSGSTGVQVNIPLSVELSDRWVTHWNAGATLVPSAREPGGAKADTLSFNHGASAIFSVNNNFSLMFEAAWSSFESVEPDGSKSRGETAFLSPGMRFAVNFESGLQIVPGIAFPVGVGPSKGESGVLAYLSFEHPFF
ncbi:MAG: transporter [Elusimicrobia bacterium]|nr:transporter [Elusimicrobiota bacterium]